MMTDGSLSGLTAEFKDISENLLEEHYQRTNLMIIGHSKVSQP